MVSQEIEKAINLHQKYGRAIVEDQAKASLINRYGELIEQSYRTMREVGIIEACTACGGLSAGGCCYRGVEEWYDAYLLLINLLFKRELPGRYAFPEGCLFVGENGCRLRARHSFCVNFLCPDLIKGLNPDQQMNLSKAVGAELQAGWELEKVLRLCLINGRL